MDSTQRRKSGINLPPRKVPEAPAFDDETYLHLVNWSSKKFDVWKIRMQIHLTFQHADLVEVITQGPIKIWKVNTAVNGTTTEIVTPTYIEKDPSEYTSEERERARLDSICKNLLYQVLDDAMIYWVKTCTTSKEIWDKIIEMYEESEKIKKNKLEVALLKIKKMRMRDGETMEQYDHIRLSDILNELGALDKVPPDNEVNSKDWEIKAVVMKELRRDEQMSCKNMLRFKTEQHYSGPNSPSILGQDVGISGEAATPLKLSREILYSPPLEDDFYLKLMDRCWSSQNFDVWKIRMHAYLTSQHGDMEKFITQGPIKIWKVNTAVNETRTITADDGTTTEIITPSYIEKDPSKYTSEDRKRLRPEIICKSLICQALDDTMLNRVKNCTTSKEIWDTIIEICEESEEIKKNNLELALLKFKNMRNHEAMWDKIIETCEGYEKIKKNKLERALQKFENMKMRDGETMEQYDIRLSRILRKLGALDKVLPDNEVNSKILSSLSKDWEIKAVVMKELRRDEQMSTDELISELEDFEYEKQKKRLEREQLDNEDDIALPFKKMLKYWKRIEQRRERSPTTQSHVNSHSDRLDNEDDIALLVKKMLKYWKRIEQRRERLPTTQSHVNSHSDRLDNEDDIALLVKKMLKYWKRIKQRRERSPTTQSHVNSHSDRYNSYQNQNDHGRSTNSNQTQY